MNNNSVNLAPLFASISDLYKKVDDSNGSLLNYSSMMQPGFDQSERLNAVSETEEKLNQAQEKLERVSKELDRGATFDRNVAVAMAEALNGTFKGGNINAFEEAPDLDFKNPLEIVDLNLYHAADVFAGLLVTLDKIFAMNVSIREMYQEPLSLQPKAIRDLQDSLDSVMLKMHNMFKKITVNLDSTIFTDLEETLMKKPTLMNRNRIDAIGSVVRFLKTSRDGVG